MVDKKIVSLKNPVVKYLAKLNSRRARNKEQKTILEGYRLISRAIDANYPIEELYICPKLFSGENEWYLIDKLSKRNCKIIEFTENILKKIAYQDRPKGLLALAPIKKHTLSEIPLKKNGLYLVIETIEKPGNLGAILRSADASAVTGVIVCEKRTDLYNPNVLRASTGAIFYIPVAEASSEEAYIWLKRHNIKSLAATPHCNKAYDLVDMTPSVAVVTGSEHYGLSDFWIEKADEKILIPMYGKIDSLNVAIATSIILFEATRQRRIARRR